MKGRYKTSANYVICKEKKKKTNHQTTTTKKTKHLKPPLKHNVTKMAEADSRTTQYICPLTSKVSRAFLLLRMRVHVCSGEVLKYAVADSCNRFQPGTEDKLTVYSHEFCPTLYGRVSSGLKTCWVRFSQLALPEKPCTFYSTGKQGNTSCMLIHTYVLD